MGDDWEDDDWDVPDGTFTRVDTEAIAAEERKQRELEEERRAAAKAKEAEEKAKAEEMSRIEAAKTQTNDKPMLLVDFTALSDGAIHNKHGRGFI